MALSGLGEFPSCPLDEVGTVDVEIAVEVARQAFHGRDQQQAGTGEEGALVVGTGANGTPGPGGLRDTVEEQRIDRIGRREIQIQDAPGQQVDVGQIGQEVGW